MTAKTKTQTTSEPQVKTRSIRFNGADIGVLEKISEKTGIQSDTDIIRMGLRALAEKLGIQV